MKWKRPAESAAAYTPARVAAESPKYSRNTGTAAARCGARNRARNFRLNPRRESSPGNGAGAAAKAAGTAPLLRPTADGDPVVALEGRTNAIRPAQATTPTATLARRRVRVGRARWDGVREDAEASEVDWVTLSGVALDRTP